MKKGFTLVEIMIVVAIIALLAAIAIPNLLRARLNANEGAAISNVHTLSTVAQSFWSATGALPLTLNALGSANPPYIDNTIGCATATCTKSGYIYGMGGTGLAADFFTYAAPQTPNVTGVRSFCVGSDGVVRVDAAGSTPASQAACIVFPAL
ncbi:MAG: prepilin-type N-terminal cleavage/methylation domain-containing protein [Candidatus Omnitrophica bacterium]|nr:prepilin-type N-terminal cleavage/methylation domain-containing protein [Candidatus Omnitrophota bacterium]